MTPFKRGGGGDCSPKPVGLYAVAPPQDAPMRPPCSSEAVRADGDLAVPGQRAAVEVPEVAGTGNFGLTGRSS